MKKDFVESLFSSSNPDHRAEFTTKYTKHTKEETRTKTGEIRFKLPLSPQTRQLPHRCSFRVFRVFVVSPDWTGCGVDFVDGELGADDEPLPWSNWAISPASVFA